MVDPRTSAPAPRFLALGDSYTIGEGVEPHGRWPVQLAAALRAQGLPLGEPRIIATTGWTTDELDAGIDAAAAQAPIDDGHALVSLLIGVNNQYRGRPLDEVRPQFTALLARAAGFAAGAPRRGARLGVPDWGVTPFAFAQSRDAALVGAQVGAVNAVCREEGRRAGAHWGATAPGRRARRGEAEMLVDDGLHPSAAMYALWSALAQPAARAALQAAA